MGFPRIALAHYSEGLGHATRMLGVAKALDTRGSEITIGGGGPGTQIIELNGYSPFEPTPVEYIDDVQRHGSLFRTVTNSVPKTCRRVVDFVQWLREVGPDALVTDDGFAALAGKLLGIPLYVVRHDTHRYYDATLARLCTGSETQLQSRFSRRYFFPAVWEQRDPDEPGITLTPPLACTSNRQPEAPDVDVLFVPSNYTTEAKQICRLLQDLSRDVTRVGGPDWEPVPSLQPYIESANVVVCSGYSTVMEAAVAGTPCVVYPVTTEQRGVADRIDDADTEGFVVARSLSAIADGVRTPPTAVERENGAPFVAESVLDSVTETAD